ncbi:T9SS type A sorting domain-containing protein [Desertivirga xinjiangensis]|uniref:T9SS type A sorting domain-containing protein n=1 Tax=Desertivirga xinjiangensis TaxID=539206 RepID=UPI00210D6F14|nr:T9SS type A sorting domain-containing protein [Pedobacter xinjiangensis]
MFYPNPVKGTGVLHYNTSDPGMISYTIFSASGQAILRRSIPVQKGKNMLDLDTSTLAAGYYVLSVIDGGKTGTSIPFVKQ